MPRRKKAGNALCGDRVIGAGPSATFPALLLAQHGLSRPCCWSGASGEGAQRRHPSDSGKESGRSNPESNVQFVRGSGTVLGGKAYMPGCAIPAPCRKGCWRSWWACVANPEILSLHPPTSATFSCHRAVRRALRSRIEALGGEIRFQCKASNSRRNGGPNSGTQSSSSVWWGCAWLNGPGSCQADQVVLGRRSLAPATLSPCCHRQGRGHRSQAVFASAGGSSIPNRWSTRLDWGPSPAIHVWPLPVQACPITGRNAGRNRLPAFCMCPGAGGGRASGKAGHVS